MHKNSIDWVDCSASIITGCLNDCKYCYARKQSKRFCGDIRLNKSKEKGVKKGFENYFHELEEPFKNDGKYLAYPFGFEPTFHKYRLGDFEKRKNGSNILVCEMGDMFGEWVPDEWIEMIFKECEKHPRHNYFFLTKNPTRYYSLGLADKLPCSSNMWYGSTLTKNDDLYFFAEGYNCFVNIEPISEKMDSVNFDPSIKWLIVGAEFGQHKNKIVPQKDWIESLLQTSKDNYTPIFMQKSLKSLMGESFLQQVPDEIEKIKRISPKNENRTFAKCNDCGQQLKKAEMQTISARKGRESSAKVIGFLCEKCFKQFAADWNK